MLKKKRIILIAIPILIILSIGILFSVLIYKVNIIAFKVNPAVKTVSKALNLEKTGQGPYYAVVL